MSLRDRAAAVLAFNAIPTTILLLLVYVAIFSAVIVTDELPSVPKNTRQLDFDQAWLDLHQVSARPHSFNSHANDLVRDYILNCLEDIASHHSHVAIDDDLVSNATWASGLLAAHPRAVYQEGNNILVKVEGSDPQFRESGGYLLSAHFDSVSTAPGTTDDSMGVVTLLQMVKYFAEHRPKRTVVFNINNNEEAGLNGAHAFLEHPWAKISDVFLNLEGAAAGGRPVMFRATGSAPLSAWTGNHVPHPHANVIMADAFARGVVRSATDYSVYEQAGVDGLDFAFYRGRSRYHTLYDSIPGMEGGRRSLWAMMEATHGASLALANEDAPHTRPPPRQEKAAYFELFGTTLQIISLETMFVLNVVFLTAGPIILLLLACWKHVVRLSKRIRLGYAAHPNGVSTHESESYSDQTLGMLKTIGAALWYSSRFWVALIVSILLQGALIAGYSHLNPFIFHSHPFLVFTSALSLAYVSLVPVLSFPCNVRGVVLAPEQQKLTILLHLYAFTWVLLVFSTVILRNIEIGGTYFITAWNQSVFLGCVVALFEAMTNARGFEPDTATRVVSGVQYETILSEEEGDGERSSRIIEDSEPTETTPLVPRERPLPPKSDEEQGAIGWWILQLLLVVPMPVILVYHIAIMLLGSMYQTLTDGNSPIATYSAVSLAALLIVLPMAPFSINAHRSLTLVILIIFALSTAYTWVTFPFSQEAPLKVYFAQTVDLTASGTEIEHIVTALTGPKEFLASHILPELPSAVGQPLECIDASDKIGLQTCSWEVSGDMAPSPGGEKPSRSRTRKPWVSHSLHRTGPNSARINVQGLNTRYCTLDFTNRHISTLRVTGDGGKGLQEGYEIPDRGLGQIQLWSRDFGKAFAVEVEWKNEDSLAENATKLEGRVGCGWDEYERGTIGGGRSGGKIPSLEEVFQFLPEWAVVSKSSSSLFHAGSSFAV